MERFRTFTRSATSFETFARARKTTYDTGLTREEAYEQCQQWNAARTSRQIRKGTKLEFDRE
jgi:hypothetical protein